MGSTTERARLAALVRRGASPERIDEARRELRASVAEDYIRKLVDGWPPLTAEQRDRLALLLHSERDDRHAAAGGH